MNRNRMIVLAIVALVLSGGVTYLAYRVIQQRLQPAQETSQIVVAAKKIEFGRRLLKDDVKLVEWPRSTVLEGSFSDPNLILDRGVITPMQVNEPILEAKLAPKEGGAGLMTIIPEGMRALSIQVNSVIGVSGFVLPGARVDLILTAVPPSDAKGAKGEEMGSKIILENLEVLAAGQNVQRDIDGKPQTVQDVTLLVTPDQAQRVALATGGGRIQLALRNPIDKDAAEPLLVVRSDLYAGPTMEGLKDSREKTASEKTDAKAGSGSRFAAKAPNKAKAPLVTAPTTPPPPPQRSIVVEVIQGSKRSQSTFDEVDAESIENSTQPE